LISAQDSYKTFLLLAPIKLLLIFLTAIPFTFLFYGNWNLAIESLKFELKIIDILIIIALIASSLTLTICAIKILNIFSSSPKLSSSESILEPHKNWLYTITLWIAIALILVLVLHADFLKKLSYI